jgi:hypothetical protein
MVDAATANAAVAPTAIRVAALVAVTRSEGVKPMGGWLMDPCGTDKGRRDGGPVRRLYLASLRSLRQHRFWLRRCTRPCVRGPRPLSPAGQPSPTPYRPSAHRPLLTLAPLTTSNVPRGSDQFQGRHQWSNKDLDPSPLEDRKWSRWDYVAVWWGCTFNANASSSVRRAGDTPSFTRPCVGMGCGVFSRRRWPLLLAGNERHHRRFAYYFAGHRRKRTSGCPLPHCGSRVTMRTVISNLPI